MPEDDELDEIFADADAAVAAEDWEDLRECLLDALAEIKSRIEATEN